MRYRKKPVVVDAVLWDLYFRGDVSQFDYTKSDSVVCEKCCKLMADHGSIKTLEGSHIVCPGDWIITVVKGEKYPCKPDIFELTYDSNWLIDEPLTLFALCKDILDFAEHGDYSNGNVAFGTDEGQVRAGECLDLYRKKLEEFEKGTGSQT